MISILLFSFLSSAEIDWFNQKPVYENALGYVRSPETGIAIKSSQYRGTRLYYLDAEIGRVIPVVRWKNNNFNVQLGLEASGWFVLGYTEERFPLITQDFLLAAPIMFKYDNISGALSFRHLSSHRGDGFDLIWEKSLSPEEKQKIEVIEQQQNISISPPIKNYSRDFWTFELAKETNIYQFNFKSYYQIGYIHKIIPHNLKRWFGGGGTEIKHSSGFYFAEDIHYYQDVSNYTFSLQSGWLFEGYSSEPRMYIGFTKGSDRRGQFLGRTMDEVSIGFAVR